MSTWRIIVGIVLFALVTAFLYVWGLKKSITQDADLEGILLSKSAKNVVKYLQKNGTITEREMFPLVEGVKGGMFWSRKRVAVQDPAVFVPRLIRYMVDQRLLEQTDRTRYQLKR